MNKEYTYLLSDDGGVSQTICEILLPIGTRFRHEYGFYIVKNYVNGDGEEETRFSRITMIWCEREYKS